MNSRGQGQGQGHIEAKLNTHVSAFDWKAILLCGDFDNSEKFVVTRIDSDTLPNMSFVYEAIIYW